MKVTAIKTHKILPKESIFDVLNQYCPIIPENSVLAITSKIISVCQNRMVTKTKNGEKVDKQVLVQEEADFYLEGEYSERYGICLTIKNGILIPSAGIDESNGNGYYLLYPKDIQSEAIKIWQYLRERNQNKRLGVLITDSHTTPLRRGVTGIGLGWCGFAPLYNYIGKPDIFGHSLRVTQTNVVDGLASSAVFMMGEGNEQTPLVLLEELNKVSFQECPPSLEEQTSLAIALEEDLYAPLLSSVQWQQGGS